MKKFLSMVLVCTMLTSLLVGSASASSANAAREAERARLHNMVREQLVEQDSLALMSFFDEIIDEMISQKYDQAVPYAASRYYAPQGGWMAGTGTNVEVEAEFFNIDQTEEIYNNRNASTSTLKQIIKLIIYNAMGVYGTLLSLAEIVEAASVSQQWSNIDIGDEGCYFYAVYDTMESKTTTVILPWTPPYMSLGSTINVTDYHVNDY